MSKTQNTKKQTKPKKEPAQKEASIYNDTPRNIAALILALIGICSVVSIFFPEGKFINAFAVFFKGILGWGYWIAGACMLYIALLLFFKKDSPVAFRVICLSLLPVFFAALINIFSGKLYEGISTLWSRGQSFECAGVIGGSFASLLVTYIGTVASCFILIVLIIVLLFAALGADASSFKRPEKGEKEIGSRSSLFDNGESISSAIAPDIESSVAKSPIFSKKQKQPEASQNAPLRTSGRGGSAYNLPLGEDEPEKPASRKKQSPAISKNIPLILEDRQQPEEKSAEAHNVRIEKVQSTAAASTVADTKQEKITKEDIEKETKKIARDVSKGTEPAYYAFPDVKLLKPAVNRGSDSESQIYETQERLENALHSFGVYSNVVKITPGPTVTRYDIELEQGVKLSKVTNLSGDIALSLGVQSVRIAPIPDEISTVGIEVPNKIVNTVSLREIIESQNFRNSKSRLSFAIGKDIGGNAIVGNISKLPHMLIAGTTGSGKSVCMNSLIVSILFKARPDEVKFIMIDPKMVELGIYNSIPHLYVPVVTEPKKAAGALQWAVVEMLKRYRLFSDAGVRDLETYNQYCAQNEEPTLPSVVIVIDELADLMMAASKEVEESICRIAQMGRAAGMHLVIATQRPSADVITGLMKANIPSRIAFAVSSAMESRIIMDTAGAEKLIGHGDMLYSPIGCGKPLRVQGAFLSDEERENVINYIKTHSDAESETNEELREFMEEKASEKNESTGGKNDSSLSSDYDEMLSQAAEVVLEMQSCSVSMLQRRLKLGYARAARVVDQLEELGVVGPYEGAKPRSVPISREDWKTIAIQYGFKTESDFELASAMSEESDDEEL